MTTFILSFQSPKATLLAVGGKGANLAEMTRAGFSVPPGFLISTDAYRAFVQANQIQERIIAIAKSIVGDDPQSLENASSSIRALFTQGQMPAQVASDIKSAYHQLSAETTKVVTTNTAPAIQVVTTNAAPAIQVATASPLPIPVAVRSSATAEDLPGLSFAGQQETYLNVIGPEAVLQSVQQCWSSLWTVRALGYRARNGIPPDEVALAVVVQTLIPAASSGVAFTANPLTGHRAEMVIDASFGLGEAVVSGLVEPDHYVVGKEGGRGTEDGGDASNGVLPRHGRGLSPTDGGHQRIDSDQTSVGVLNPLGNPSPVTWRITERSLGEKALAVLPRAEGGTEQVPRQAAQEQALPDEQILALAGLCERVAAHFGSPQDIEWAWADGQLYILQSRPITTLYPLPELPTPASGLGVYLSFNALQGIADPITPLGIAALQTLAGGILRFLGVPTPVDQILVPAGGRLYFDVTGIVGDKRMRHVLFFVLARGDPAARQTLMQLVAKGRIPETHVSAPGGVPKRLIISRVLAALHSPEQTLPRVKAEMDASLAELQGNARSSGSLAELLAILQRDLPRAVDGVLFKIAPLILPAFVLIALVDRWLAGWLHLAPGAALSLLRGIPGNVTTEMDLKLWAVAQAIRGDPAAAEALRNQTVDALTEAYRQGALPEIAQRQISGFLDTLA